MTGDDTRRAAVSAGRTTGGATRSRRRFLRSAVGAGLFVGGLSATGGAGLASAASVFDATLTVQSESSSSPANDVSASLSNGLVVVEGTIAVPTPCYSLELGPVRFDGDQVLVVPVLAAVEASTPEPCPQVVTAYDYRVEVSASTVPETVAVTHDAIETWETELDVGSSPSALTPQNLRVTDRTATSLSFEWDAPLADVDVDHYELNVFWTDVGVMPTTEAASIALDDSIENLRMSPDTEYTVSVRAVFPDGSTSAFTPQLQASTLPADEPTTFLPAPVDLRVVDTAATSVDLRWSMPIPDVEGVELVLDHVEVSVDGELDHRLSDSYPTETTVTDLDPDTTYEFAVRSVADDGTTSDSTTATATTDESGSLPPVGDNENAPTDPDGDGLYEDVNGNGDGDLADAVDLFQHSEADAVTNNTAAYDFSGNDEVDLADVVQLFQENAG